MQITKDQYREFAQDILGLDNDQIDQVIKEVKEFNIYFEEYMSPEEIKECINYTN